MEWQRIMDDDQALARSWVTGEKAVMDQDDIDRDLFELAR
jgi:hypothetical protein